MTHLRQSESGGVYLVSFRHKTKTPRYVAAIDLHIAAEKPEHALLAAEHEFRRRGLNRRWWTISEPVKTLFAEVPRS